MAVPSQSYMQLTGGTSSGNSTIYTSSLIKIGDAINISGIANNNGIFSVIDITTSGSDVYYVLKPYFKITSEVIFSDDTCDYNNDPTITHDANANIIAGLYVSGIGIPDDATVSSITSTTEFELSASTTTGSVTNGTLTFQSVPVGFTDATCDYDDDPTIVHDVNANIIAGLRVTGKGIPSGATVSSITDTTHFELSASTTGGAVTNGTLTFNDADPQIDVVRAPGDKMVALGDVDSSNGIDVWSNNATTDPSTKDNGWSAAAINPTLSGNDAKYIFHFIDDALRVCNINEQNSSLIKWYGYIQRHQFGNHIADDGVIGTSLLFSEWEEYPNDLSPPKVTGSFSYAYGHTSHSATTVANYYKNKRGLAINKEDSSSNLRLDGAVAIGDTTLLFENESNEDVLDQSKIGEVISIATSLGSVPSEYLFCKKISSGVFGGYITFKRGYGAGGTAPFGTAYLNHNSPIVERGLGFNIGVDDGTDEGDWEDATYEFYQTFIYDGNQESIPVQMGDGAATTSLDAFTHDSDGALSLQVSVYADLAYNGRITGGRIYIRKNESDDDLVMLADIDLVEGVRMTLDAEYNQWTYEDGKGYSVLGNAIGNSKRPNLDTYTTINGFSPDVKFISIGGDNEIYKASTNSGRRTFIANVKTDGFTDGLEKFGDRIMYSEINKFDTFLPHNFIDVSKGDYGEYTALESYADRIIAFKHNLVHIINVSSPNISGWFLEETIQYAGVNYPFSVAKTKYGIAWLNESGCFLYDGKSVRNLLDKRIGVSATTASGGTAWYNVIRGSANVKDPMIGYDAMSNSLIIFKSPNDSSLSSNIGYIYDFDSDGWVYHTSLFTDDGIYTNFVTDWNNNLTIGLYDGSSDVNFFKYLPAPLASSSQVVITKDIDFGLPGLAKKIYSIIVTYKAGATQANPLEYAVDGKASFSDVTASAGTITTDAGDSDTLPTASDWDVATFKLASPISCQSIQFKWNPPSSGTLEINDMTVEYRVLNNKNAS
jgi:hypothetical protein